MTAVAGKMSMHYVQHATVEGFGCYRVTIEIYQ